MNFGGRPRTFLLKLLYVTLLIKNIRNKDAYFISGESSHLVKFLPCLASAISKKISADRIPNVQGRGERYIRKFPRLLKIGKRKATPMKGATFVYGLAHF